MDFIPLWVFSWNYLKDWMSTVVKISDWGVSPTVSLLCGLRVHPLARLLPHPQKGANKRAWLPGFLIRTMWLRAVPGKRNHPGEMSSPLNKKLEISWSYHAHSCLGENCSYHHKTKQKKVCLFIQIGGNKRKKNPSRSQHLFCLPQVPRKRQKTMATVGAAPAEWVKPFQRDTEGGESSDPVGAAGGWPGGREGPLNLEGGPVNYGKRAPWDLAGPPMVSAQ